MKTLLVIMFMINGDPTILDGYGPMETPSEEICNHRNTFFEAWVAQLMESGAGLPFQATGVAYGCLDPDELEAGLEKMVDMLKSANARAQGSDV